MSSKHSPVAEMVDGFLFVSNRPALDFLNTIVTINRDMTDLLINAGALERWFIASGIVSSTIGRGRLRQWQRSHQMDAIFEDLTAFRERLRLAVYALEDGEYTPRTFVSEVNAGLVAHPPISTLHWRGEVTIREWRFEPENPEDLWAPVFDSVANLLSDPELRRLRKCEACLAHFLDVSKQGSRRWCSMKLCGNRFKVASYQKRKRAQD